MTIFYCPIYCSLDVLFSRVLERDYKNHCSHDVLSINGSSLYSINWLHAIKEDTSSHFLSLPPNLPAYSPPCIPSIFILGPLCSKYFQAISWDYSYKLYTERTKFSTIPVLTFQWEKAIHSSVTESQPILHVLSYLCFSLALFSISPCPEEREISLSQVYKGSLPLVAFEGLEVVSVMNLS